MNAIFGLTKKQSYDLWPHAYLLQRRLNFLLDVVELAMHRNVFSDHNTGITAPEDQRNWHFMGILTGLRLVADDLEIGCRMAHKKHLRRAYLQFPLCVPCLDAADRAWNMQTIRDFGFSYNIIFAVGSDLIVCAEAARKLEDALGYPEPFNYAAKRQALAARVAR